MTDVSRKKYTNYSAMSVYGLLLLLLLLLLLFIQADDLIIEITFIEE